MNRVFSKRGGITSKYRYNRHLPALTCYFLNRLILSNLLLLFILPSHAHQDVHAHNNLLAEKYRDQIVYDYEIPKAHNLFPVEIVTKNSAGETTPSFIALRYADALPWKVIEQPFLKNPRSAVQRSDRPQWKNKYPIHSNGWVTFSLPKGRYKLWAGKGLEYATVIQTFDITGEDSLTQLEITLERFIDMPARGWWSGDPHVHIGRTDTKRDREILWAAQAEDIHVTSLLVMGDSQSIYFPQYSLGNRGTVQDQDYWLVPGQEEPRTSELGHTIILNTQKLYRDTENYYRYDQLFKAARNDGAVTGIAHYFYDKFCPKNAGTLLFPDQLVDFVELMDNAHVFSPSHYYDALNMGFRAGVTAGSDFPWGAHIGDNRTYALLQPGEPLTPKNWYNAVKAGRTFATQGPLLEFSVNGKPVGSIIPAKKGDTLNISVRTISDPVLGGSKHLKLISMGEVIQQKQAPKGAAAISLSVTLEVDKSIWLAAAARDHSYAYAHSSPIYVQVEGQDTASASSDTIELYRQSLARIDLLKSASPTFIPPDQHAGFIQWLERVKRYYLDALTELGGHSTEKQTYGAIRCP